MAYRKTPAVKAHLTAQRQAIIEAATGVVAKHGRERLIPLTVERASVSMGTIYKYFADVDELWKAVVAAALARNLTAMREAAEAEHYPVNALTRALAVFYDSLNPPRLARALAEVPAYRKAIRTTLEPLIGRALDVPPRAREQHAAAILGALYGLADVEATNKTACIIALRSLGVPEAAARALA